MHNTRIERLWYNLTHDFGSKWKSFFIDLEMHHGLDPTSPHHIWLLHHLFLASINTDAQEWAEAWNNHSLQIRGERTRSPKDIYFFSMVQDGPRGIYRIPHDEPHHLPGQGQDADDEEQVDPNTYAVDYEEAGDERIIGNLIEREQDNPFTIHERQYSHVECEPPQSPFSAEYICRFDTLLAESGVLVESRNILHRRQVWIKALEICNTGFSIE